jgi:flagellar biosynthesis/type III secretory pathway protein FliH
MVRIFKARAASAPRVAPGTATAGFVECADQAAAALEHAHREAAQILAVAHEEARRLQRETEQRALAAARQSVERELRDEFETRMAAALPALSQAAAALHTATAAHLRDWEQYVLRLAVTIAERVIRRELSRCPDIPPALVREALDLAAGAQRIEVHVHPADYETLGARYVDMGAQLRDSAKLEIIADAAVGRGGCVLRTEFGTIDQQIAGQLARIEEELS